MKINVDYLEYKNTIGDNMKLIAENHKLKEEVKKKDDIINKALEYLNKCNNSDLKFTSRTYDILFNIFEGGDQK